MTRSSTNKLFTPYKEPGRQFRSSRRHFKTLSLDELISPDFNLLSDQEYSEPKIEDNDNFELRGQFLKELSTNTFSGSDHEDENEHIEKVLEIVDLFYIPNITIDQVMLRAFHMSLTGAASRWLRNEPTGSITTWDGLKTNVIVSPVVTNVIRETKASTTLLSALPDDHIGDFYHLDDAKEIWLAIKARFGGNEESKKMQKSFLKQEFEEFKITEAEGLHTGYDKFQKILSQMNTLKVRPENEDVNLKFLRALPPSWSQVTLVLKTKGGLKYLSFDDLYNKLKSLEFDVKGYAPKPSSLANAAFVSTAST
ncbi:hypothetical protein Tco_0706965, partial [Tanacetum coccineum]